MGNESRYTFTVMGKKCPVAPLSASRCNVRYDRLSLISLPGMQLTIPAGMVQEGLTVIPKVDQGVSPDVIPSPNSPVRSSDGRS